MKKPRFIYAAAFCALLLTEILIGLFVHDHIVRPYIGDVLVTILLCCFCRVVVPRGVPALSVYVFIFAVLVEVAQYFEIVKLVELGGNQFFSTLMGTTFSAIDLICYAVGCFAFWATEKAVRIWKCRHHNAG